MLAIRMQRTGRKGHAQFRLIVQESQRSPVSGNIVASLGNYDPHTKKVTLDSERASFYLEHGAQPSPRVALLLKAEGVKLPKWVKLDVSKQRSIKNVEKLRRNRPASEEPKAEAPAAEPTEATEVVEEAKTEAAEQVAETTEAPAENAEPVAEATDEKPVAEETQESTEEVTPAEEPDIEKVAEETGDDKVIEPKPEAEA